MNRFDELLKMAPDEMRRSVVAVGDTCFMAKVWFEAHGVDYTADDLLRFAEIALRHETGNSSY